MALIRYLLVTGLACIAGCDFGQTVSNLVTGGTATHLTAITLFEAPTIPGLGGEPTTVVRLFFGTRPIGDVDFHAVNGATVSVADDVSGVTAPAVQSGNGFYLSSSRDGGVGYDIGATYTFTILSSNDTFVASGTAPVPEAVALFENTVTSPYPEQICANVAVGQSYTLTRSATPDASGQLAVAFLTVAAATNPQQPTWTNAPSDATGILHLAIDDTAWRVRSIAIPGTAFPTAGAYIVTLTAIERGTVDDRQLFSGSAVLIGSGVAGVVAAQ